MEIKKLLVVILAFLILYYASFLLLGKDALINSLSRDGHSSYREYRWTKQVVLISNIDIEDSEIRLLERALSFEDAKLKFVRIESYDDLGASFNQQNVYQYILMVDSHYLPWITIEESEHMNEYVCFWKIKYVWLFFKWMKTKDEQTGIS